MPEASLSRLRFMAELVWESFMVCSASVRIWIFTACARWQVRFYEIFSCYHWRFCNGRPWSWNKEKDKKNFGKVESAFLKDNTDVYDVTFQTEKSIKIKIEVDTCPPLNFKTEQKLLLQPHSFMTRCFTLPDLFAGKMHALVYRAWKNRVKGRDWYDFEWYVRHNIPLDLLIWQNDASSSTMRISLQSYSRRNSLSVSLQLI